MTVILYYLCCMFFVDSYEYICNKVSYEYICNKVDIQLSGQLSI